MDNERDFEIDTSVAGAYGCRGILTALLIAFIIAGFGAGMFALASWLCDV